MRNMKHVVLGSIITVLSSACSDDADVVATPEMVDADGALTFYQHMAPIFSAKCMGCHQEGGIGPFALNDYDEARRRAAQIADYTAARVMPPFLIETGGECGSFDESIALTDAEIALIGEWARGDRAEGTPTTLTPPALPELADGTEFLTPSFTPVANSADPLAQFDEYRCFSVNMGLTEDAFITGYDVLPGNKALVHHVIGFVVNPNQMADMPPDAPALTNAQVMQALDEQSPDRDGWPCFGMAGEGLAAESAPVIWAPGQGVVTYPGGLGVPIARDRSLVIQVHYNLADGAVPGDTDQTKVRLRLASTVERQGAFLQDDALLGSLYSSDPRMLEPGQESVKFEWTRTGEELGIPPGLPTEIVALFPHMHERGNKYVFEVANGESFECAGRVNDWDFNWQRIYTYADPVPLTSESRIRVTCDYDTSGATAPVLPGWGTRNEMCFVMMMVALPPGASSGR